MRVTLTILVVAMVSCMELHPLPSPESQPVSSGSSGSVTQPQPPTSTPGCPALEKNLLGSWKYTSNYLVNPNGGSTKYSGRITFNAEMTVLDPDTLLGYKIGDEPVTRRGYEIDDNTLRVFVADRQERQLGVIMTLQANQCDKLKFAGVGKGNVLIELTR